jgi:hypothetical protein
MVHKHAPAVGPKKKSGRWQRIASLDVKQEAVEAFAVRLGK